jgi:hypothetical protein
MPRTPKERARPSRRAAASNGTATHGIVAKYLRVVRRRATQQPRSSAPQISRRRAQPLLRVRVRVRVRVCMRVRVRRRAGGGVATDSSKLCASRSRETKTISSALGRRPQHAA